MHPGKVGPESLGNAELNFGHAGANVLAHGESGGVRAVALDDVHEVGVPLCGHLGVGGDVEQPVEDEDLVFFEQIVERGTAGTFGDAHVEADVERLELELVLAAARVGKGHLIELACHERKLFALGGVGAFAEETGGLDFEGFADDVAIANVVGGRDTNAGADAWQTFEHALCFEPLHGFGNRNEAHPEFRGDAAAGDGFAEGDFAFEDFIANLGIRQSGERGVKGGGWASRVTHGRGYLY